MPRTSGLKKTRFTLWLSDEVLKDLARQQEATGKGAVAEVIREAVEVYRSLLQAKERGVDLYFQDSATGEKGRILRVAMRLVRTGSLERNCRRPR